MILRRGLGLRRLLLALQLFGAALLVLAPSFAVPGAAAQTTGRQIRVPWIAQATPYDCGRAVLASLAARRGGNITAIYRQIPPPADTVNGYSIREMLRLGARFGALLTLRAPRGVVVTGDCAPSAASRAHLASLARTVAAGRPVVVPVSQGFSAGHYLILVGASSGQFTVHDPASSGLSVIDAETLDQRMCQFGRIALIAQ